MKYYKYIIILILLLICTLLYMQLEDYENISNSLLSDNIKTKAQMKELSDSVDTIKEHSKELQQKINTLHSIIDAKEIEIELLEKNCIKKNITLKTNSEKTIDSEKPTITLENENEVTKF